MTESVRKLQINLYDDHRKMNPTDEHGIYKGHEEPTLDDIKAYLAEQGLVAVPVEPFDKALDILKQVADGDLGNCLAYRSMIAAAQHDEGNEADLRGSYEATRT